MKSSAWYFHEPSSFYALGPFRFDRPKTEAEARAYVREWLGVKRLPRGSELWTAKSQRRSHAVRRYEHRPRPLQ